MSETPKADEKPTEPKTPKADEKPTEAKTPKAPKLGDLKGYDLSSARVTRRLVRDGGGLELRVELDPQ